MIRGILEESVEYVGGLLLKLRDRFERFGEIDCWVCFVEDGASPKKIAGLFAKLR